MRVQLKFWRPLVRRFGPRGAIIIAAAVLLVTLAGGTAVRAWLIGGAGSPLNSNSVQLSRGLVGHWKMDGNAKDSTPYNHNATVTGAAALTTDQKNKANGAYQMTGNNHNLRVPITNTLKPTSAV